MFTKLLERLGKEEVPETSTEKFLNLRHGVPGGFKPGSVLAVDNYVDEPWPHAMLWLHAAGATLCEKPAHELDGRIDFAAAERERLMLEETQAPKPALPRYPRAEVRAMFDPPISDADLNDMMHAGIWPRPVLTYIHEPGFGAKVLDVVEGWQRYESDRALEFLARFFPKSIAKRTNQ